MFGKGLHTTAIMILSLASMISNSQARNIPIDVSARVAIKNDPAHVTINKLRIPKPKLFTNCCKILYEKQKNIDNGVIINKETTLTREPTGPAVINGYAIPNANDPRSVVLSSQQATREQKYQLKNPVKGNNGY